MFIVFLLIFALFSSSALHIENQIGERRSRHVAGSSEQCLYGTYQSPIHIEDHRVQKIILPALELTGYHNYLTPLTIHNDGHTVVLKHEHHIHNSAYKRPQITGSTLKSNYVFESLHFHWGLENDRGSEHSVNLVRYPMEMHLVHRNVNYNSTTEALNHKDGIAVLGFFFQLQLRENRRMRSLVKHLRHITEPFATYLLDTSFPLASILPRNLDAFFTYEGSLTTPPCSEAVTWFVFPETIPLSFKQIAAFRKLSIADNYRPLQAVGQRKIYLRRSDNAVPAPFEGFGIEDYSLRSFWLH